MVDVEQRVERVEVRAGGGARVVLVQHEHAVQPIGRAQPDLSRRQL